MDTNDLPKLIFETFNRHIPPGAGWLPMTVAAVTALLGFVFLVKGARLAPILASVCFGLLGAAGGKLVSGGLSTPFWPSVAVGTGIGLVLGVLLLRLWLAVLAGVCLIVVGLSIYTGQVLRGPLNSYLASGLDRSRQLVTLPNGSASDRPVTWQTQGHDLWTHLSSTVPNFQPSFYTIVLSAGLAGLVLGLLLPRVTRAFWAASFGTGLVLVAVNSAAHACWPAALPWVNQWGLVVAAVLWGVSLLYNLADLGLFGKKPTSPAPAGAPTAA